MWRMNLLIVALAVITASLYLGAVGAEEPAADAQTVQVTGQAVVFNNDKVTARDKAIEDALRKSVEQVVGTQVSASTMVQNFEVIEDKILTNSKGYVKTYKVIGEKVEDGVFIVTVEATVLTGQIKGDLSAISNLLAQKEYPRVMLLIAEQAIGQTGFSYWWGNTSGATDMGVVENTIIDQWGTKGFRFVDHSVLSGKLKARAGFQVTSATGLSNSQVEEIANLTDAQIVITGTAVARDAGTIMGTSMHSGQANISLRVINTDNGEILATATVHGAAAHIDTMTAGTKSLQKAAINACNELMDKVMDKWAASTSIVQLEVEGIADYKTLNNFKGTLFDEVRGVKGVYERKYAEGVAEFDVNMQGKVSSFAAELEGKTFKYFTFKVISKSANKLRIKATPTGGK